VDVYNHFREIRYQIDQHREELKKKIDEIALEMIDQTQKFEATYLKNIKEHFSSFDDCKSLEYDLNHIEHAFRDPNLLLTTIQEMQQRQEESLNELQLKLNEINQVKDSLVATNQFKPNLALQGDTSSFGSIRLNGHWLNSFDSQIIKGEQQWSELINLCEFSPNDKWSLLYRGTRDGFGAKDFHSKCDGHSNTLTILKAKQSSYIFGGFNGADWDLLYPKGKYKLDPDAFLFSLTNRDSQPIKMKINPNEHRHAIYSQNRCGPTFGFGHDINIADNANTTWDSYSDLGKSYLHPQYAYQTNKAQDFLAGSFQFQLDEIEVYQKE